MSDVIRISEQGKRQLIGIKRSTKINRWNVLCRWAMCISLREAHTPPEFDLGPMSNVEMTWETFAGPYNTLFIALLRSNISANYKTTQFEYHQIATSHIHRGISVLSHNKVDLLKLVTHGLKTKTQ